MKNGNFCSFVAAHLSFSILRCIKCTFILNSSVDQLYNLGKRNLLFPLPLSLDVRTMCPQLSVEKLASPRCSWSFFKSSLRAPPPPLSATCYF